MYRPAQHFSMQKPYASLNMNKFPEDIECIIAAPDPKRGSLYISNIQAAENLSTLNKHRITAVLSCAKGYELKHPASAIPDYKYIPTLDKDECDISIHFDEAVDFIAKHLAHTNVLVHCIAGVSRSVSMVLAYFIREHNMTYHQAYTLVKAKRKIIHPNDGFIRQLKAYEGRAKTEEKRRESSPSYRQTPTQAKRNNYLESNELVQFKSAQLVDDALKGKTQDKYIGQYKSSQLTPKKPEYKQPTRYQFKSHNQPIYRTSTTFFTPNKSPYPDRMLELQSTYAGTTKTQQVNRYPADQKPQNVEAPQEGKQQVKQQVKQQAKLAKTKETSLEPQKAAELPRKHQFEEMNKQLNQKIELIRQKYDNQRKKLYERYQTSTKTYQSVSSPYRKTNAAADLMPDYYGATHDRKRVSLTVDRLNQRRDDFLRPSPTTSRDNKTNVQLRDYSSMVQSRDRVSLGYNGVDLRGYNGVEDLYTRKIDSVYTTSKGYNDYRFQSDRFDGARIGGQASKGYTPYSRYNLEYSFKRY